MQTPILFHIQREQEILERVTEILVRHLTPERIFLFGSRAKATGSRYSDFDLAVDQEGRPEPGIEREILEEVDRVAGLYHVDIVYLNSVDEAFKDVILKTGKIIYERRS